MTQNRNHLQLENRLKDFAVLQFEPTRILMQHRPSRKKYIYKEFPNNEQCRAFLECYRLRKPCPQGLIDIDTYTLPDNPQKIGILYDYYVSDLDSQLARRTRNLRTSRLQDLAYSQQQLLNTFTPILSNLKKLHGWGQLHGNLRGRHIVITEEYEMRLCDGFLLSEGLRYEAPEWVGEATQEGDLWALGLVMLESASLQSSEQFYRRTSRNTVDTEGIEQRVREIQYLFSDDFVIGLKLLLSANKGLRSRAFEVYLDKVLPDIPQVQLLRPNRSKPLKMDRQYDSQSPKKISSYNSTQRTFDRKDLQQTIAEPEPTLTPNLSKKQQKQNDSKPERIKIDLLKDKFKSRLNEDAELKKKQIDKINKIIERSNAFVNELMVKKQEKAKMPSLSKTTVPSVTVKLDENTKNMMMREQFTMRRQQPVVYIKQQSSPIKQSPTKLRQQTDKLRSLSKKK